jgi:two-component system sensor histidine kinase ResE
MSRDSTQTQLEELTRRCAQLQDQVDRAKLEQFNYLQNVSHQLVAPLNAIKWHIENIQAARLSEERQRIVLRSIYSQSTIAVHLAKNFLLLSNLEADHALTTLKEPLEPVSLCRLSINLASDFQPLGWDKGITIQVERRHLTDAPDVLVMKSLISQAFSNIIENALKYSRSGSTITISGSHDPVRDTVTVEVTNHGIPLPENVHSVFSRGFRSSEARNKHPAGTGFGLYIAKRIVDIHEGSIAAHMTKQGTAVFTISLSVRGLEGKARQRDRKNRTSH